MRPRRLRRMLALSFLGALIAGASLGTGIAKADPLDDYTVVNAPIVCALLNQYPTVAGVEGVVAALHEKGLTSAQAGEVVGRSVIGWCPANVPEVQLFIAKWAPVGTVLA